MHSANSAPDNHNSNPDTAPARAQAWSELENWSTAQATEQDPQVDLQRVTNFEVIRAHELAEVAQNPDVVGLNYDAAHIVWPQRQREIAEYRALSAGGQTDEQICAHFAVRYPERRAVLTPDRLQAAIAQEESKVANLQAELAQLPDGAKFRVHTSGAQSPFTTHECIRGADDGSRQVEFDTTALRQVAALKEKAAGTDLTVVMNFWNGANGAFPQTPTELADYTLLCQEFVRQTGFADERGYGLVLELGNETNVNCDTRDTNTGQVIFDRPEFDHSSDPATYAQMYASVAAELKREFPELKLSLAGTAFYDPTYLEQVISAVEVQRPGLIDIISFHPYRAHAEDGTAEVINGQRTRSHLDFRQQFAGMQALAEPIGATVTVGESSFTENWGQSINLEEESANTALMRELGTTSYIWPGTQILRYP